MLDERQITKQFLAPYLRNTDVQWAGINVDDLPEMDFDEDDQKLYSLRPGDILMCEGGEIGRCAIWDSDRKCFYQKALHRLRPTSNKDDPHYFVLVMRAAVEAGLFSSRASAATIQHLPAEKLRVVRYPAPPIEEQRAIVAFVSGQTVQLDALLAVKQRILDLLAEKRKAIIATAVTRGLDLKVKLRDSGVPWLGEIPAHWEVERTRWLFRERDLRGEPDLPLMEVSIANGVVVREFESDRIEAAAADFNTYKVARKGDIAFNKMRMWQGAVGATPVDGLVSPDYVVAEPCGTMCSDYAALLFKISVFSAECGQRSHGLTWDRLRIYWEEFREIELPLPPLEEQHAIVDHIARETARLDAVRTATERTITLLKERRAALIAAAVTGQLDVGAVT
jgi:type I restriction enzyme S subunit